jgi:hypothetical protein
MSSSAEGEAKRAPRPTTSGSPLANGEMPDVVYLIRILLTALGLGIVLGLAAYRRTPAVDRPARTAPPPGPSQHSTGKEHFDVRVKLLTDLVAVSVDARTFVKEGR